MRIPRMSARLLMRAIAGVGLVLAGIKLPYHVYYGDLIAARDKLADVRGIAGVQVYGWDDMTYEVHRATFALEGRPGTIVGCRPIDEAGHVWIDRLGPWQFAECRYRLRDDPGAPGGEFAEGPVFWSFIDLGPAGDYAPMLPVAIRDLDDVVAHYDELVRFFREWPDGKAWGELRGRSGLTRRYCAFPAGSGSPGLPNAPFPGRSLLPP